MTVQPHRSGAGRGVASDVATDPLDLRRVGHDAGRLVLHFERRVALSPMRVREALLAAQCADAVDADERWDVEDDRAQSRLALTAWIDAADVETAAGTGAAFHSRFDEVVRAIEQDAGQVSSDGADLALVTDAYRSAFAAALADTD